jgi:hypothetical protein
MNFNLIFAVSLALHSVAAEQPAGMVWISGGESTMGSDQPGSRKNEQARASREPLMAFGSIRMTRPTASSRVLSRKRVM